MSPPSLHEEENFNWNSLPDVAAGQREPVAESPDPDRQRAEAIMHQKTDDLVADWFYEYEPFANALPFDSVQMVLGYLEQAAGPLPLSEAVKAMLDSYISTCERMLDGADTQTHREVERVVDSFDMLFGMHPNFCSYLGDYQDILTTATDALKIPELHGTLAAKLVAELNYRLSFDQNAADNLSQAMSRIVYSEQTDLHDQNPTVTALEAIDVLESAAREGAANGAWSSPGIKSIQTVLKKLGISDNALLATYAAMVAGKINQERKTPSLGVARFRLDNRYGRMMITPTEAELAEEDYLLRAVSVDQVMPIGGHVKKIASNALAITDQGLIPQYLAIAPTNLPPDEELFPVPELALHYLGEAIELTPSASRRDWNTVIRYYNEQVWQRLSKDEDKDFEALAQSWADLVPQVSQAAWKEYLRETSRIAELRDSHQNIKSDRLLAAEELNRQATEEFVGWAIGQLKECRVLTEREISQLSQAETAYLDQDLELAYEEVSALGRGLVGRYDKLFAEDGNWHMQSNDNSERVIFGKTLEARRDALHQLHRQNFASQEAELAAFQEKHRQEIITAIQSRDQVVNILKAHQEEVDQALLAQIKSLTEEARRHQVPVHFARPHDVLMSEAVNPLNATLPVQIEALLQRLHQPDMRQYIEQSLGISLNNLSLSSQVYLLDYMLKLNISDYHRLETIIRGYSGDRTQFLESFLALQIGDEFGTILLDIVEKLSASETTEILNEVSQIRQLAERLRHTAIPPEFDQDYGLGAHLGIVKRMTEILSTIPLLADGQTVKIDLSHLQLEHASLANAGLSIDNIRQPKLALHIIRRSLEKIIAMQDASPKVIAPVPNNPYTTSLLFDHGAMTIRERETAQGEPRVGFKATFSPVEMIEWGLAQPDEKLNTRSRSVSIRLDLEQMTGRVSIDFGGFLANRNADNSSLEKLNSLIATCVTAGSQQIARLRQQSLASGSHHSHEGFSPQAADPDHFAHFAQAMIAQARQRFVL